VGNTENRYGKDEVNFWRETGNCRNHYACSPCEPTGRCSTAAWARGFGKTSHGGAKEQNYLHSPPTPTCFKKTRKKTGGEKEGRLFRDGRARADCVARRRGGGEGDAHKKGKELERIRNPPSQRRREPSEIAAEQACGAAVQMCSLRKRRRGRGMGGHRKRRGRAGQELHCQRPGTRVVIYIMVYEDTQCIKAYSPKACGRGSKSIRFSQVGVRIASAFRIAKQKRGRCRADVRLGTRSWQGVLFQCEKPWIVPTPCERKSRGTWRGMRPLPPKGQGKSTRLHSPK